MATRLVFAGTSSFAVPILQSLSDEGRYAIAGVVTQPDRPSGRGQTLAPPPVKAKALELGLPVHQPLTLRDDAARRLFETLAPDLLVVVAYGKILPKWLLALPRFGAVNLHGSLLPRYRGAAPIQWAIANGDAETGVCAMQLDEGLDTGPVYACEATPIGPDEDFQQLSVRLAGLGCALMKRTVEGILNGTIQPVPQDQTRATLAPILRKEDGSLDWNLPAQAIHNRIRAFNPWPGTRTTFRGESCRILKSRRRDRATDAGDAPATPGGVIVSRRGERFLAVTCGDGAWVELVEVQMPNRRPQAGMDFVNGFRVMTGEILGHPVEPVG